MDWNKIDHIIGMSKKEKRRERRKREITPRQQRMRTKEAKRKMHTRTRQRGRLSRFAIVPLLLVAILTLPSCKYNTGAYAGYNGVVLCQTTAIDTAEKPYPIAHGANTARYGSCDGEAFITTQLTVTVYLFHVEANIDGFIISRLCNGNGPITLYGTSGFKLSASDTWDCPGGGPGDEYFARSLVRGYIDIIGPFESWQDSPIEQWTLPA